MNRTTTSDMSLHPYIITVGIDSSSDYAKLFSKCDEYLSQSFCADAWVDLCMKDLRFKRSYEQPFTSTVYAFNESTHRHKFTAWCRTQGIHVLSTEDRISTGRPWCSAFTWSAVLDQQVREWCEIKLRTNTWDLLTRSSDPGGVGITFNCSVVEFDSQHQKTMFDLVWSELLTIYDSSDAFFEQVRLYKYVQNNTRAVVHSQISADAVAARVKNYTSFTAPRVSK
jgi:hypothetical protein